MAFQTITDEEVAQGAPLDTLTLVKMRDNQEYLKNNLGGGGGSLDWSLDIDNAASELAGIDSYNILAFEKENKAKLMVKAPSNFEGGVIPKMALGYYSGIANGSLLIQFDVSVKLLRGNDTIELPTDSLTLTSSLNNAPTSGALRTANIELATLGGIIGTTAIAADDILAITLTRKNSDTLTSTAFVVPTLTNISFSE